MKCYKLDTLVPLAGYSTVYWIEWIWGGLIKRRYITLDDMNLPWEIELVTGDLVTL